MGILDWLWWRAAAPAPAEVALELMDGLIATRLQGVEEGAARVLWDHVKADLSLQLFELCENYHDDAGEMPVKDPYQIWDTMVDARVLVRSSGTLELCTRFSWQDPEDGHWTTFYVEDGQVRGHSVDG
jgi:hypothetical protein